MKCNCKEHHKHECYFGKKPCDSCKLKNCQPSKEKECTCTLEKNRTWFRDCPIHGIPVEREEKKHLSDVFDMVQEDDGWIKLTRKEKRT